MTSAALGTVTRTDGRRRWSADDRAWRADGVVEAESPTVMDSWLVHDGRTRAPRRHADRFVAACTATGLPRSTVTDFLDHARLTVPARGRWFPRVELVVADGAPALQSWLRPAPPRGAQVRLMVHPGPDERRRPQTKGPDQAFLGRCRQAAIDCGADDAVLLAPDGTIRETTSAALLWWRGDVLCGPPGGGAVLASVTAGLVREAARAAAFDVVEEWVVPASLTGLETWAVNALHGIRPVAGWIDGAVVPGAATRAREWNHHLDLLTVTPPEPERPPTTPERST